MGSKVTTELDGEPLLMERNLLKPQLVDGVINPHQQKVVVGVTPQLRMGISVREKKLRVNVKDLVRKFILLRVTDGKESHRRREKLLNQTQRNQST
jgi:hypothetical protein